MKNSIDREIFISLPLEGCISNQHETSRMQKKLTDPKVRNSTPKDVDPAAVKMLPWLPDTP